MVRHEIEQALIEMLHAAADAEKALSMNAYMKNLFPHLGVQTPLRRKISAPLLQEAQQSKKADWDFVRRCWNAEPREFQYVALDYLIALQEKLTDGDIPSLKELILAKSWWDTIDGLDRIVGCIALRFPEVNETLRQWSVDENIWLRRIAIDHQLLRKERTNTELLEEILVNNLDHKEFFIRKAIGWALRDYSKTNPPWVYLFIEKHRAKLSPLSLREASRHLKELS